MTTITRRRFILCLVFSLLLPPSSVAALDFNPNYILSDSELQDTGSMNRGDIQAFLEGQNSYLADYRAFDASGTLRFASDIIYQAAREHTINPKYLLVKLQKEQSLVKDPDPTQRQLDWATGYGVCDSCRFDDPSIQKFKGFATQVDKAAGVMRWYFDNLNNFTWIKKPNTVYTIDSTPVTPANLATAFLYTYTPHLRGNQNFWTIWQQWFEQVYPNGTLLKSLDSPTVFVLDNGKKRPITSMTALLTRYDPKQIIVAPASELARYADGAPIALPNYSILKTASGEYYLLDFDTLRPFASEAVVRALGYNPQEIMDITPADVAAYTIGSTITADTQSPTGRLIRAKEVNQLYYLKDNLYYSISDERMATVNHPNLRIETIPIGDLASYASGGLERFKDGTLIGIKGFNEIYVIDGGKKRHITSEEVFNGLGYSWANVVWLSDVIAHIHPTGEAVYLRRPIDLASVSDKTVGDEPRIDTATTSTATTTLDVYIGTPLATTLPTYLVAEAETGTILAGKNIDTVRPAASLTKVMTGYQLLLDGLSLQKSVRYNPDTQRADNVFRLARGEQVLNEHLMQAMLVSSLNTPSRMLVSSVEKNEANFIKRVNDTVRSLGLTSTQFTDTSGLDLGNVTTAREYLTLYQRATRNADMQRIMAMPTYEYYELVDTDDKPRHYDDHSNDLVARTDLPFRIITSKTGYLPESGSHLAMHIERRADNKQFIVITMGNTETKQRFIEPENIARQVMANL